MTAISRSQITDALQKVKADSKRKFLQTIDLVINLKDLSYGFELMSKIVQLPAGRPEPARMYCLNSSDLNKGIIYKKLVNGMDFFLATKETMPIIAKSEFGKCLALADKMPTLKNGLIVSKSEDFKELADRLEIAIKLKLKNNIISTAIGKENWTDEDLIKNILQVLEFIKEQLPMKEQNIKSIIIKKTMGKAIKVK